ncbi:MAG: hypothetical protein IKZ84_04825 [Victivallales bacterium]|nr:hypothetical protein [Victivallales bacterium]
MKKTIAVLSMVLFVLGNTLFAQDAAANPPAVAKPAAETAGEAVVVAEPIMVPTTAVLHFEARSRRAEGDKVGKSVSELLFVNLLEGGNIDLVERAELDKALDELHLSAVGMDSPESQVKLGQIIGAKILITGSVFDAGEKHYLVAKIIGVETSRVKGCSVSGTGDYLDLVPELAQKVRTTLETDFEKLLPKKATVFSVADRLADVKGAGRKVYLNVKESIQQAVPDPASDIALKKLLLALDFQVVNVRSEADFAIVCEAIASQAGQYHKFSSAEARVELSVYQVKENKLLSVGARKETMAGATYVIAAKDAINQATLKLAADVLKSLK